MYLGVAPLRNAWLPKGRCQVEDDFTTLDCPVDNLRVGNIAFDDFDSLVKHARGACHGTGEYPNPAVFPHQRRNQVSSCKSRAPGNQNNSTQVSEWQVAIH
jgi:hypothetical protein